MKYFGPRDRSSFAGVSNHIKNTLTLLPNRRDTIGCEYRQILVAVNICSTKTAVTALDYIDESM